MHCVWAMFQTVLQLIIWKNRIKRSYNFFSVDFNPIYTNYILDIHKSLMNKKLYKIMFNLVMKTFIGLLTCLVNG